MDNKPVLAFIALGSNLENPVLQLQQALIELEQLPQCRLVSRSSLYRSAPVGKLDQPDFINAVAALETVLTPPPVEPVEAPLGHYAALAYLSDDLPTDAYY